MTAPTRSRDLDARRATAADDQLGVRLVAVVLELRLGVTLGLLDDLRRRDLRARRPRRDRGPDVLLDRQELLLLLGLDERDRAARAADATRAPDAMHVDVGRARHVVVDDVRHGRDVQPAGGDVGGDEDRHAAALEAEHHAVARALGHVAVQRLNVEAAVLHLLVELVGADLRAREDDRLVGLLGLEHLDELVGLVGGLDVDLELLDGVDGQRRRLDFHEHRVVEVVVGELGDRRRHRRPEERRLAAVGRQSQDLLDVLQEAEVEHLVGFVEHDEAAALEHQRAAVDEVEHPPDGADDDVPAGLQLRLLGADRRATEDGDDVGALAAGVGADRLRDLDAQLARGREDERLHLGLGGVDVLDDRQAECGRLARSRLGLADDVAALEHRRDRLLLNRAGLFVANVLEGLERAV